MFLSRLRPLSHGKLAQSTLTYSTNLSPAPPPHPPGLSKGLQIGRRNLSALHPQRNSWNMTPLFLQNRDQDGLDLELGQVSAAIYPIYASIGGVNQVVWGHFRASVFVLQKPLPPLQGVPNNNIAPGSADESVPPCFKTGCASTHHRYPSVVGLLEHPVRKRSACHRCKRET